MKISKSKQELARIISENGGWRDGAESAVQCKLDDAVSFYRDIPDRDGDCWWGEHLDGCDIGQDRLIANWHQAILSRAEYFHLYPVPDADGWIEWNGGECPVGEDDRIDVKFRGGDELFGVGGDWDWDWDCGEDVYGCDIIAYRLRKPEQSKPEFCESVMRSIPEYEIHSKNMDITQVGDINVVESKPTIEQLAADYRNAKDYANRKQDEADKANMQSNAALSQLEDAIAAIGFAITPLAATEKEPELVITDWRDLQVGDVVEGRHYGRMVVGEVCEIDEECHDNRPFRIHEYGGNPWWVTSKEFKFISRP